MQSPGNEKVSKLAIERLRKDFEELQHYPLSNVVALPNEKNIFEWHVVCQG